MPIALSSVARHNLGTFHRIRAWYDTCHVAG